MFFPFTVGPLPMICFLTLVYASTPISAATHSVVSISTTTSNIKSESTLDLALARSGHEVDHFQLGSFLDMCMPAATENMTT